MVNRRARGSFHGPFLRFPDILLKNLPNETPGATSGAGNSQNMRASHRVLN
jgi:hypothetical protein